MGKYIFIITVLFSPSIFGAPWLPLEEDKAAHLGLSSVGVESFMKICQVYDKDKKIPGWCRIGASTGMIGIGILKEVADKQHGGKFDTQDLTADIIGVVIGNILQWEF
ncbi:MAG: hypothetical protein HQK54_12040 [Oligoflexales bacterium]|nr:hypothetical protein [Oligoflexales bacterium]